MTEMANRDGLELWRRMLNRRFSGAAVGLASQQIDRAIVVAPPSLVAAALGDDDAMSASATAAQGYARYVLSRQIEVLRWLGEISVPLVVLKGLAAALCDWDDPAQRIVGDLDLLVRRRDLPRIVDALSARNYRFGSAVTPRWGFMSDASFVPFYSTDRVCNVDLHVEPDSYPLHRGLDADAVFAAASEIVRHGVTLQVPSAEHAVLIAVSNLAKDKFPVGDARKLLDIARVLQRKAPFDWREVENRARRAHLTVALRTALSLAVALGLDDALVLQQWRRIPSPPRRGAWRRLLSDWAQFDPAPPGLLLRLQREWMLSASPAVAARLGLRRLRGLVRPRSGLPTLRQPDDGSTPRAF
ncbi:MAG: nucleotidyltransferase family protein [Rhodospirillales bacterium]